MESIEEAAHLYDEGLDAYRVGEYEEAVRALSRARDLAASAGDRSKEAQILNDLGVVYIRLDAWEEARRCLEEARTIRMVTEERSAQGITLGNLGMLHALQDEEEKAVEAYEEALAIFQELGERGNEKAIARQLNKLQMERGRFLDALSDYQAELEQEESPSGPQKVARQLFRLWGRMVGGPESEEEDEDEIEGEVIDVPPDEDE
jgi:tetratricopeptide (TPR) repeat protein